MSDSTKRASDVVKGQEVFIPWLTRNRRATSAWLCVKAITNLSDKGGPKVRFHGTLIDQHNIPVSYTFAASEEVIYRACSH